MLLLLVGLALFAGALEAKALARAPADKLVSSLVFKPGAQAASWYVWAYQADVPDPAETEIPARLCFSREPRDANPTCVSGEAAMRYPPQFVEALSIERILPDAENSSAVLFVAKFNAVGSGSARWITLWGQEGSPSTLGNKLPHVVISEQGEYRILPRTSKGHRGVFVTADYRRVGEESHFATHHFDITIYKLRGDRRAYTKVRTYRTAAKYPSLDDVDAVNVIGPEMAEIEDSLDTFKE
jgi:hypothetical protein